MERIRTGQGFESFDPTGFTYDRFNESRQLVGKIRPSILCLSRFHSFISFSEKKHRLAYLHLWNAVAYIHKLFYNASSCPKKHF